MDKYPVVYMTAKVKIMDEQGNAIPDLASMDVLSFGGYYFVVDGKTIPFDWDAYKYRISDYRPGLLTLETGRGLYFDDYSLSKCYDSEYDKLGLSREDLTAEFLSKCTEIEEFFCNEGEVLIDEIVFFDENDQQYPVNKEVIEAYNRAVLDKEEK